MKIRANRRLGGVTSRILWLFVALSASGVTAAVGEEWLAAQVRTSRRQLRRSLEIILEAGLFTRSKPKGIHRASRYRREYGEDETAAEFVERMQSWDKMNVVIGLHWVACGETVNGPAEFPTRDLWQVSDEALRKARQRMNQLGHFKVESRRERGTMARYWRVGYDYAEARKQEQNGSRQYQQKPQNQQYEQHWDSRPRTSRRQVRDEAAEAAREQRAASEFHRQYWQDYERRLRDEVGL